MSTPSKATADVSVALASFNGGRYILQQLRSIGAQTVLPAELVVADDGSTDDTVEQVEWFSRQAPFSVRIIRNPRRLGFADNFLSAIKHCRSAFVALSDQDDVWLPQKLERCMRALGNDRSSLVMHSAHLVDTNLRRLGVMKALRGKTETFGPLALQPMPGMAFGMALVFARRLAQIVDPALRPHSIVHPQVPLAHDEWIFLLASVFGRVSTISEPLALYRQHGNNLFGQPQLTGGTRLKFLLEVSPFRYEQRRRFCVETAELLTAIADGSSGEYRERARQGSAFYQRLAGLLVHRIGMHQADTVGLRLGHFASIARAGGYASSGLGTKSLVKDLLFNVSGIGALVNRRKTSVDAHEHR